MSDDFFDEFEGKYLGQNPLINTLKENTFKFTVDKRSRTVSRWIMLKVNDELRSTNFDNQMQYHRTHGFSKLENGSKEITPSPDMTEERIMAVRIYNGGPYIALVNLAYYYHYGAHRCNLAQDSDLGEAVYC